MLLRCRLQVPSPASRWGSSGGSSRIRSVGLHLVVGCSRPLHLCLLTSATAAALVDPALSHRLLRSSPRASPLCSSALCAVVRPRPRSIGERVKEGGKGASRCCRRCRRCAHSASLPFALSLLPLLLPPSLCRLQSSKAFSFNPKQAAFSHCAQPHRSACQPRLTPLWRRRTDCPPLSVLLPAV